MYSNSLDMEYLRNRSREDKTASALGELMIELERLRNEKN